MRQERYGIEPGLLPWSLDIAPLGIEVGIEPAGQIDAHTAAQAPGECLRGEGGSNLWAIVGAGEAKVCLEIRNGRIIPCPQVEETGHVLFHE